MHCRHRLPWRHAYLTDLYVAPMNFLSLKGMVSHGFEGNHELVCFQNRFFKGWTPPPVG